MATIREIIDYSKANPETEYAKRALMLLKRGDFDEQARQEQIDLSFAGRQTVQPKEQGAETMSPDQMSNKTTLSNIIPKIGASFQEGNVRLAENAQKTRQRVAEAGGTPLAHLAGLGETIGNVAGETAGQVGNMIARGAGAAINAIGSDSERITNEFLQATNIAGETNEQTLKRISEAMDTVGDQLPEGVRQSFINFANTVGLYGGKKVVGDPLEAAVKTGTQEAVQGGKQILSEGVQQTKAIGAQAVKEGKAIAGAPYKVAEYMFKEPTPKPVENVLRETKAADFDKIVEIAKKRNESYKNKSPLEAVGDRAVAALDQIERKRKGLASDKNTVMSQASVGRKPVGNIAVKFRQELNNYLSGKTTVEGDSKLVKKINSEAEKLGANPTAKDVDKFIDFAQEQLYTAGQDLTVPVTDATTAALRRMIGRLNTNLKNQLPESYSNINARMSKLYDIRDELNLKLGKDGEKGGALMKRIFSPSDNRTKELFADVLDETGIDLINEATIARYVMDAMGSAEQKSMLDQLNLPKMSPGGVSGFVSDKMNAIVNSPEEILRRAREMTIDGAPKKINKANEAGISVGLATKNVADNIHPDDLGEMRDFVDYVAGEYKPKNPINLEATVTEIAEKYGITLPKSGKNAALADKFARILDKAKLDQKIITDRRKMRGEDVGPKRDDLGRFATNEGKAQGAIPPTSLVQEAKKYKSAEEFVKAKTTRPDYGYGHSPNEDGVRAFNLTEKVDGEQMIPEDMYQQWYGSRGTPEDMESISVLKKIKDKPDASVTIYRAAPSGEFNYGDWVTLSKKYAQQHAEGNNFQVFSQNVKAKDIRWAMDDVNEFGYFPEDYKSQLTDIWKKANEL